MGYCWPNSIDLGTFHQFRFELCTNNCELIWLAEQVGNNNKITTSIVIWMWIIVEYIYASKASAVNLFCKFYEEKKNRPIWQGWPVLTSINVNNQTLKWNSKWIHGFVCQHIQTGTSTKCAVSTFSEYKRTSHQFLEFTDSNSPIDTIAIYTIFFSVNYEIM